MEKYDAIILAAGSFPTAPQALAILGEARFLCCCDSAAEEAIKRGYKPNVVVGDGDSIPEDIRRQLDDRFIKIEEQNDNDLTKATRHCISLGHKHIAYLGATGLREDHTLGNIFLLPHYKKEFDITPTMITDHGFFRVGEGDNEYESFARQQVSIFNISCKNLSSEGLKWPLYPTTQLWQGTLNEALNEKITIHSDGIFIIFQTYEPKG